MKKRMMLLSGLLVIAGQVCSAAGASLVYNCVGDRSRNPYRVELTVGHPNSQGLNTIHVVLRNGYERTSRAVLDRRFQILWQSMKDS